MSIKMAGSITSAAVALSLIFAAPTAQARIPYRFHVSCPEKEFVLEWRTGDIDPGREYLRLASGTNNPGCDIANFDATRDDGLPVVVLKGEKGILKGLSPLGYLGKLLRRW